MVPPEKLTVIQTAKVLSEYGWGRKDGSQLVILKLGNFAIWEKSLIGYASCRLQEYKI
jgi:hypothetical protein